MEYFIISTFNLYLLANFQHNFAKLLKPYVSFVVLKEYFNMLQGSK